MSGEFQHKLCIIKDGVMKSIVKLGAVQITNLPKQLKIERILTYHLSTPAKVLSRKHLILSCKEIPCAFIRVC